MTFAENTQNHNDGADEEIPSDLDELLRANRAGTIAPEEQRRLEEYLKTNTAALEYYLSLCAIEGMIPATLGIGEKYSQSLDRDNVVPFQRRRKLAFLIGISACALVVGAIVYFARGEAGEKVAQPGWQVANVFGASYKNMPILAEAHPVSSVFSIDAGVAELVLARGARVLLEAPASLEITGSNSCRLNYGKAVVDVPTSAIGFTMDSPHNRIVDHGTRFAVDASQGKKFTFVGVLSGMVDVEQGEKTVRLYTNYAVEQGDSSPISVPLDRSEFLTEMPTREYAWNLDGTPLDVPQKLSFDITPLMRLPGSEISIIYKWLTGGNAIRAKEFRLECDGKTIETLSVASSSSGAIHNTFSNNLVFKLPEDVSAGKCWKMYVTVLCDYPDSQIGSAASSRGIFLFEKNLLKNADYSKFIGRWAYSHNGIDYIREFRPDGTWSIFANGKERVGPWITSGCLVEDGVLRMPFSDATTPAEKAILRDDDTMIFLNRPYRNAIRIK